MQSIDYEIVDYAPSDQTCIQNIQEKNPSTYWSSSTEAASIVLKFEPCKLNEIELSLSSASSYQIISKSKLPGINIAEGISPNASMTGKSLSIVKLSLKDKISNLEIKLTAQNSENLKIFHIILKGSRENEEIERSKPIQATLKSMNFYSRSPGNKSIINKSPMITKSPLQATSSAEFVQTSMKKTHEKPARPSEKSNSNEEQIKIYQSIQNSRQKTLKNFLNGPTVASTSYQNLMSTKGNYVVTCLDDDSVRQVIAEICGVVGICYFPEIDQDITHIIYSGDDLNIFLKAHDLGIKVVSKLWLFHSIDKRLALDPDAFIRKMT